MRKISNKLILIFTFCVLLCGFLIKHKFQSETYVQYKISHLLFLKTRDLKISLNNQKWITEEGILADKDYIDEIIESFNSEKFEKIKSVDFDWTINAIEILFKTKDLDYSFVLSQQKNFENKYYVKDNVNQNVFLISSDLAQLFMNENIFFLEKHPYRFELSEVKSIRINQFTVKDKDVKNFLDQLNKMTVQKYIQKIDYQVEDRELKIDLIFKDNKNIQYYLTLNEKQNKLFGTINNLQSKAKYYTEFDMTYWQYFANYGIKDNL